MVPSILWDAKRFGSHLVIDGKCGLGPVQEWMRRRRGFYSFLERKNRRGLCPLLESGVDSALTGYEWEGVGMALT